jgi:hypothetical protein
MASVGVLVERPARLFYQPGGGGFNVSNFQIPVGFKNMVPKDGHRYAIGAVEVRQGAEKDEGFVTATDGRILAIASIPAAGLAEPVLVGRDDLPTKSAGLTYMQAGDHFETSDRRIVDAADGSFPPVPDVLPDPDEYELVCALDVGLLHKLAQAISPRENSVTLYRHKEKSNIRPLVAVGEPGNFGVIMPRACDEQEPANYAKLRAEYLAACGRIDEADEQRKAA